MGIGIQNLNKVNENTKVLGQYKKLWKGKTCYIDYMQRFK